MFLLPALDWVISSAGSTKFYDLCHARCILKISLTHDACSWQPPAALDNFNKTIKMPANSLNTDFIKQFRHGQQPYISGEQKFQNICFKRLSGNKYQTAMLCKAIAEELGCKRVIRKLVAKLTEEDEKVCKDLTEYAQRIYKIFLFQARKKPSLQIIIKNCFHAWSLSSCWYMISVAAFC